jgi:hypothetical protein
MGEIMKELLQKFGTRTFGAPAGATGLAFFNDAAQLGLEFRTMVLVVAASLAWSLIETLRDVARMKYAAAAVPSAPPPPTTLTS